jgi:putative transposase
MPTARFCSLFGVPERTWRRWQAKARAEQQPKGPWPQPVRQVAKATVVAHASQHVSWGHRKIWAMTRRDGVQVSPSTVMRALRDENLLQSADYQRERRQLAAARKAAFLVPPTGPNQVWQLDFSDFETIAGGTWRIAGCRDYVSKFEPPWHISPTANHLDAIEAVELALAEYERLFGHPLADDCQIDLDTGELLPVVTLVTDNGGPFRAFRFETFIAQHPELRHVRTRVRSPGQNGSRERGFESLKYERLYLHEIADGLDLARHAEAYRIEYNTIRPHEALAWNCPLDVHLGLADPAIPTFETAETLPPS